MSQTEKFNLKEVTTSILKPTLDSVNNFQFMLGNTSDSPCPVNAKTALVGNLASNSKPNGDPNEANCAMTTSSLGEMRPVAQNMAPQSHNDFTVMSSVTGREIYKNIVDDLNKKRAKDASVTNEFHTCVIEWANEATSKIIESMYKKFQENSLLMSAKFELIEKDLELIGKLEQELKLISMQVESLYNEIRNSS